MSKPSVSENFVRELKSLARETGLRLLLVWHPKACRYAVIENTVQSREPRTLIIMQDNFGNYEHPSLKHILEMRTKIDFKTMKKFLGNEENFWSYRERLKRDAEEKKKLDHRAFIHDLTKDNHNQIVRYARQATGEQIGKGLHVVPRNMKDE